MQTVFRVLALIAKEFATILQDPKSRFVVIGPPVIQFFVFGYAATFDVTDIPFAVFDESRTTESRQFISAFAASDTFRMTHQLREGSGITDLIDTQEVRMVLHIHQSFAERLTSGRPAPVQVIVDGRNSNVAGIANGYAREIAETFNRERIPGSMRPALVERAWYNPNFSSRWYIVSCLGGVIATVVVTLLTSLSVAREREFGTFDQLLVTPLTPLGILVGKSIPPVCVGMLNSSLLSAAAVFWYGVPFMGSVPAAALVLLVFMLAVTGVGLFISSLSNTMQQGLLGSFVFIMPAVILSGFTSPIDNMPPWLQSATWINPLRWAVEALRNVFLEGGEFVDVIPALWPLSIIATVTLSAAVWLFRHKTA